MRVGVVTEIKPDERRVALTPAGARALRQRGHQIVVLELADAGQLTPRLETGSNVASGRLMHPGVAAAFSDLPASSAGAPA